MHRQTLAPLPVAFQISLGYEMDPNDPQQAVVELATLVGYSIRTSDAQYGGSFDKPGNTDQGDIVVIAYMQHGDMFTPVQLYCDMNGEQGSLKEIRATWLLNAPGLPAHTNLQNVLDNGLFPVFS